MVPTKASLGGSWQPVGLTEEGLPHLVFIKGKLNGTRQSVGADTSRPPCTGIEWFVCTAHFHYFPGG